MHAKKLSLSLILIALLLAACGAPAAEATLPAPEVNTSQITATPVTVAEVVYPLTITDGLQRTITLDAPAQRVVSLAASNTELLFAIGAGAQVVGRDPYSDFPVEALGVTDIGDTSVELNAELVVSLQPDLVLAAEITPPEQVAQLEQLGVQVFWLQNSTDFESLYANLNTVAALTDHEQEAAALVTSLRARVSAVESALADVVETKTVFYELDASDPAAPWTSGAGTFIDLLISRSGGQNVGSIFQDDFVQISIEELLVQDPDVILLGDAPYAVTVDSVEQRAGWAQLSAVQSGNVFELDIDLVNSITRPGPRLVDALEQLARLLHPDQFN